MKKIGLVLEGGGFRGLFVEGVIEWLLDNNIEIPYVIGVSMGALNGATYVSKQKRRNLNIAETFIDDPRYISTKNLVTKGRLFGMDFIFDDIVYEHNKFDFETYNDSKQEFVVGTMNCDDGTTSYIKKSSSDEKLILNALRASTSLPFIAQLVDIDNTPHLDGGLTDPIPVRQALKDGCDKVIIITTRDENYIKEPFKGSPLSKVLYRNHPNVSAALKNRHIIYTQTQGFIKGLEESGKAFVIRPESPIELGRTEKDKQKFKKVYQSGYETAKKYGDALKQFIINSEL